MAEENLNQPILHEVLSLQATAEPGVLVITIDVTDSRGDRFTAPFGYRPDDPYGLSPMLRQWLAENEGSYTIEPAA